MCIQQSPAIKTINDTDHQLYLLSVLNSEQVSLMRPICIENWISLRKQMVLIVRVVLILNGLYSGTLL